MTEPGAPTSAPPPLAAMTATPRDLLGRSRRRRRPGRLRTPERASAPPHNRTAPRGAPRHARARGRGAPAAPPPSRPLLICRLGRGRASALGRAGERGRERRVSSGFPCARGKERPVEAAGGRRGLCARRARTTASTRGGRGRLLGNRPSRLWVLAEPSAGRTRYFPPVQSPSGPCLLVTSASSSVTGALVAGTGAALGGAGQPGKLRPVSGFQCRRPLVSRSARERGPGPCCPPGSAREASCRPACAGLRQPC